jgi:hypothetical protein
MKKVFTMFCFILLLMTAREASAQAEIDKGNVLLNAGLGVGYIYADGVPILFSAEWAINDAISIGPYLGFTSWKYRAYGYKWSYTFFDFGARGSYHFSKHLNMSTDKLDLYGSVLLGYRVASYNDPDGFVGTSTYGSSVTGGVVGGARWYFTDSFAVNAEIGYGLAPIYLGVTFKL